MTNKHTAKIVDVYLCGENLRVWIQTTDHQYYADASPQVLPRLMQECGLRRDWDRGLVDDARRLIGRRLVVGVRGGRWYGHFRAAPEMEA